MWMLVGLRNYGAKYERTRHNAGCIVLDEIVQRYGGNWKTWKKSRWSSAGALDLSELELFTTRVLAVKPRSYMNVCGGAVGECARYFQVVMSSLVVIHDDLDMASGAVKGKQGGGSGGHNGIRSLVQNLGSESFLRIKIGIGKPAVANDSDLDQGLKQHRVQRYVLSALSEQEIVRLREEASEQALIRIRQHMMAQR